MRLFIATLICLSLAAGFTMLAQEKTPPPKLVFQTKMGNVTFNHAEHVKRANGDCKTCHDKLFPMSATAALNFKANMHKTAEASMSSCGFCHRPGGMAFETKGNCNKCHVKG